MTMYRLDPENTTWTCFGCEKEAVEDDEMPQFCPKCGGVWVRPLVRQAWWERILNWISTGSTR